jgi:hypothetical protein
LRSGSIKAPFIQKIDMPGMAPCLEKRLVLGMLIWRYFPDSLTASVTLKKDNRKYGQMCQSEFLEGWTDHHGEAENR